VQGEMRVRVQPGMVLISRHSAAGRVAAAPAYEKH
jgi:hypothetical protein